MGTASIRAAVPFFFSGERGKPLALRASPCRACCRTSATRIRVTLKRPALAVVTIVTLAIGVGGNTAVFSVVNGLLIRPLPVPEAERLVRVFGATEELSFDVFSYPNAFDLGARATTLASLAIHNQTFVSSGLGDATETAAVELVSGNYFATFGVAPAIGRAIQPDDDRLDAGQPVAVISDRWWRTRFGASPEAIGATVHLNGSPFTVIGIAPASFRGSYDALGTDLWTPLMTYNVVRPRGNQITRRGWGWLSATARLAPGATIEQAQAELTTIATALGTEYCTGARSPRPSRPGARAPRGDGAGAAARSLLRAARRRAGARGGLREHRERAAGHRHRAAA